MAKYLIIGSALIFLAFQNCSRTQFTSSASSSETTAAVVEPVPLEVCNNCEVQGCDLPDGSKANLNIVQSEQIRCENQGDRVGRQEKKCSKNEAGDYFWDITYNECLIAVTPTAVAPTPTIPTPAAPAQPDVPTPTSTGSISIAGPATLSVGQCGTFNIAISNIVGALSHETNGGENCWNTSTNTGGLKWSTPGSKSYRVSGTDSAGFTVSGTTSVNITTVVAQTPVYSLELTSNSSMYDSTYNQYFIKDPVLNLSASGVNNAIPLTFKNTGNVVCTPSVSFNLPTYNGGQIGIVASASASAILPGSTNTVSVSLLISGTGFGYVFNSANQMIMASLGFKCLEDSSASRKIGITFLNGIRTL